MKLNKEEVEKYTLEDYKYKTDWVVLGMRTVAFGLAAIFVLVMLSGFLTK